MCLVIFCNSWHRIPKNFLILTPASWSEVMLIIFPECNLKHFSVLFCCQEAEFMMWCLFQLGHYCLCSCFPMTLIIWVCLFCFSMCYMPILLSPWTGNWSSLSLLDSWATFLRSRSQCSVSVGQWNYCWRTYILHFGIASHLVYSWTVISTQHSELCFSKMLFLENMEHLE